MFSTSSTASSVTEAPRRMFVPTWTWTKPSWAQPELSIGRELKALDGSHRCWETIGPVLDLTQKIIFPAVRTLLKEQEDYLTEREPIWSPVTFEMYMTGRRKEEANPTLLFCCSRVQPRKRAKKVVMGSQILRDHPTLRVAHSNRSPQARTPIRVFVGPMKGVKVGSVEAFGEVYCISPVDRTCGVPVFMRRKDGSLRKATIGGIVQLDDKYYGLTVAHTFIDDGVESTEEIEDESSDMECSFDSDDDLSVPDEREPTARFEQPHPRRPPREFSSFRTATLSKALEHIDDDQASSSVVGNLFQYSSHTGLDWALIDIDNSRVDPKTCNAITLTNEYEERTLWPRALVTTGPTEREVLAITGDKGVIQGSISRNSIYIRTAQTRGFQELWTVHMTSGLVEGDCGSWVVDRQNGRLYGQIVAGHPGTGIGYIIPASQIFESVWQTLGDALILPSGMSSKSVAPFLPDQRHDSRQAEYSPISRRQAPPPLELHVPSLSSIKRKEILAKLEFMLSNKNLSQDIKIREHMDSQGFVAIPVLASDPRMQFLYAGVEDILMACRSVPFLEVLNCKDGSIRVRLRHEWYDRVSPNEYSQESLKLGSGMREDNFRPQPSGSDWGKRADSVSGGMSFGESVEYAKENRYKHRSKFYPRSEDYLSRELPRRDDEERSAASSTPYEDPNDKAIARVLQRNEKDARRSERRDSSPIDPSRPVYTKMSRRHLSLETLRVHRIDYEVDQGDPEYVLVKRWIPEDEQEALWEHTRRLRSSEIPLLRPSDDRRRKDYPLETFSRSSSASLSETDSDLDDRSKTHGSRRERSQRVSDLKPKARANDTDDEQHEADRVAPSPGPVPPGPGAAGTVASLRPLAYDPEILQPSAPLPEGWTSHIDETSGNPYYVHVPTQIVQWEFPILRPMPPPGQNQPMWMPPPPPLDVGIGIPVGPPRDQQGGPIFSPRPAEKRGGDLDPRSKVPDSKKSRGSKSHASKSSGKGSTNASEISSDTSLSKHKSKDSNVSPLLTFLAGGKKR